MFEDSLYNYSYSSKDSLSPDFNFDTISSTRTFRIVVRNTGKTNIMNIKFTSDNPNLTFPEGGIYSLPPDIKGNSNVFRIPFIMIHGKNREGGIASVLHPGDNESTIKITGQVDNGSGYTDVEIKAKIHFYVKLMDISLYAGASAIDLANPPSSLHYLTNGCEYAYAYYYSTLPVLLKNTGNTDISLYLYLTTLSWENTPLIQTAFLHQGDTLTLKLPIDNSNLLYLILCSGGTQTNERRIRTGKDGNGYIGLEKLANGKSSR